MIEIKNVNIIEPSHESETSENFSDDTEIVFELRAPIYTWLALNCNFVFDYSDLDEFLNSSIDIKEHFSFDGFLGEGVETTDSEVLNLYDSFIVPYVNMIRTLSEIKLDELKPEEKESLFMSIIKAMPLAVNFDASFRFTVAEYKELQGDLQNSLIPELRELSLQIDKLLNKKEV